MIITIPDSSLDAWERSAAFTIDNSGHEGVLSCALVTLIEHYRATVPNLLSIVECFGAVRYLREGHETPESADEDCPVPYCFECEVPWPCAVEEAFQALDRATPDVNL